MRMNNNKTFCYVHQKMEYCIFQNYFICLASIQFDFIMNGLDIQLIS